MPPLAPFASPLSASFEASTSTLVALSLETEPPLFPTEAVLPPSIEPEVDAPVDTDVPLALCCTAPATPELALPPSPACALASL